MRDDDVKGKGWIAAYILNLTKKWNADWGGILHFYNGDGNIISSAVPSFSSITIFKVPQDHSVNIVSPFAAENRFAITGWLKLSK